MTTQQKPMNEIIVLLITVLLIGGGVYAVVNRRRNAAAGHEAVTRINPSTPHANAPPTAAPVRAVPPAESAAKVPEVPATKTAPAADAPPPPAENLPFPVIFENGHQAQAVRVTINTEAERIAEMLQIPRPHPVIFITGGAGYMTDEDKQRTMEMIEMIASFAQDRGAIVIDGGTESGIMQMIGDARKNHNYAFPLIGVAPLGKISYPGYKNPNEEAFLEDSHSHFVLVDGDEWGTESEVILSLTQTLCNDRSLPAIGVLINGGKIARQEVYLAVSKQLPMLILEGSGRFADEVATAFKTGKSNQRILQAILSGGDIQVVSTVEGPEAMRTKLEARFG